MNKNTVGLRRCLVGGLLLLSALVSVQASAQICQVPQDRDTLQLAAEDPSCTTIEAAPGPHLEVLTIRRSLTLRSQSTGTATIAGRVAALDAGVLVVMSNLNIDTSGPGANCFDEALVAAEGAQIDIVNVEVTNDPGTGPCTFPILLFADGFETGNTSRWSGSVGGSR